MKQLVDFIALVDFYKSNAKTSLLYNYCRPKILSETSETTKTVNLKAIQLRHPLIERIQESYQYVPQDITYDQSEQGILLFGVNACGKSSLMKAVGIATILAQVGLYVPAQEFTIKPYHSIMTRIIGNDNLFKGMSSFAVEMSELRGILKRANSHSLVLGDEICHGTETFSGVSLVASAIITLSQLKANFLFATHLHQLSQIHQITELNTVKMYHLRVKFDEQTGNLIYDRRLEPGSGHPIYGIEVAKAMDLDRSFIELANTIRKEIMDVPDITPIKKSKYNQQLYINQCGIPGCHKTAELTHHINFQCDADSHGFIQHLQKNHRSNLLPLCQSCHAMVHDQQEGHYRYIIRGYIMTTGGLQLDYEKILNKKSPTVTSKFFLKMKK
jgi:DNA mismatch repair protein MutS